MTDKKKAVSLQSKSVGLVAQLDRVPDYGSGGCGFDSRPVHKRKSRNRFPFLVFIPPRITSIGSVLKIGGALKKLSKDYSDFADRFLCQKKDATM